jgi:thiol:disulfide interchange protein/DsbC/DsbD-like thiol-disulfide interchange protein
LTVRTFFTALTVFAAALLAPLQSFAEPFRTENVETELHSARASVAPGERFIVVLRQNIREHWHTYWRNPGDSGEPTEITWRLPPGYSAGEIQWPAPEAIPFSILVNYGYSDEILFPIEITVPPNAAIGQSVTLNADLYWLVCSDVCIPEEGAVSLTLPVASQGSDDPAWAPRIAAAVAALPKLTNAEAHIATGSPGRLSVELANATSIRNPYFFPFSRDALNHAAPQSPRVGPRGLSFDLQPGVDDNLGRAALAGVIAYEVQSGGAWTRRSFEVNAQPGQPLPGTDANAAAVTDDFVGGAPEQIGGASGEAPPLPAPSGTLLAALAFAFLGGLILNVMPCVLPVLSIKALSFAGGAHAGEARRHGVIYLIGVMATFLALAGVLIALRGAGESAGWGFQFQAPWVTGGLGLLFFAIGLNLLGVFEIGGNAQGIGAGLASRGGDIGAFFTGALAVVAATPCTAPFMAFAVGYAVTQPPLATLAVFAGLGLGFAAPLVALSFMPALQRRIPKPGPWMERVKNVLAFPMFAAAVWLAWVFAEQTGAIGALALLSLALAFSFAVYVARWGRVWLVVGVAVLALTAAFAWRPLAGHEAVEVLAAEEWSPERVEALRAEGTPVFVNFTAAWCVTCKVNEGVAFTPRIATEFAERGITYLKADWTNRDDVIAAALAEHGRAGVPLYLYYPPGGEARVLPQLLTEGIVLQAIEGGGE